MTTDLTALEQRMNALSGEIIDWLIDVMNRDYTCVHKDHDKNMEFNLIDKEFFVIRDWDVEVVWNTGREEDRYYCIPERTDVRCICVCGTYVLAAPEKLKEFYDKIEECFTKQVYAIDCKSVDEQIQSLVQLKKDLTGETKS